MSTYTSEPGTRLAGRYRLVDQTSAGTGWTFWKAIDEPLARSVTVLTFASGFPRIAEAITAARAASRLGDPRFSQVFDVEDADEQAYVVLEWVVGESLLDMLADGPLDSPRAVALLSEAAQAMAAAHAVGLAHLRLNPACLHWMRGSGVKITGLGIDAVLTGTAPAAEDGAEDGQGSELTDTRDLGRLLYAALTGYWPGPQEQAEPQNPQEAGGGRLAGGRGARRRPGRRWADRAPPGTGGRRGAVQSAPGVRSRAGQHRRANLPGAVPAAQPSRPGAQHPGDAGRGAGRGRVARPAAGSGRAHGFVPGTRRPRLPAGRSHQPVPGG